MSLPSLPFELQFAILRQVPQALSQVFLLRRVSHAWNTMLQNPHLLDAINAAGTLPFLTTASDPPRV